MNIAFVCHKCDTDHHYKNYLLQLLNSSGSGNFATIYHSQFIRKQKNLSDNLLIIIETEADSAIALPYFIQVQLPQILRKVKADFVFTLNGLVNKRVKIPQVLLLTSTPHFESFNKPETFWQKYFSKNLVRSIQYAAAVIIYSQKALLETEAIIGAPILTAHLIYYTASADFNPLEWPQKILTKGSYTNNREFFIAVLNNEQTEYTGLLKAFSVFKKWQHSSMQFLMLASKDFDEERFNEKLATYKYRNDVQLFKDLPQKQVAALMASAYCLVFNNTDENLLALVQSLQSATPVIAYKSAGAEEYGHEAVIYCDTNTFENMGQKMIHLYKNEALKESLAFKGSQIAINYSQEQEAQKLWNIIEAVTKK